MTCDLFDVVVRLEFMGLEISAIRVKPHISSFRAPEWKGISVPTGSSMFENLIARMCFAMRI